MTEKSVRPTIDVIEDALAHRNSVADQKYSFNLKRLVRHQSADSHRRPAMAADIRPEDFVEQVRCAFEHFVVGLKIRLLRKIRG